MIAPDRRCVLGAAALGLGAGLSGCAFFGRKAPYDAEAGADGFATLAAALDAAPEHAARPFRILVRRGTWRERVRVTKPFIHLVGEGPESVIVFDRSAGDLGPDGKPIGTFATATLTVEASDFRAENLTITNGFDYVAHMKAPVPEDKTGPSGTQAVALAIEGTADRTLLYGVHLSGYQDTLFADAGRSLFRRCRVAGCTDFIFGAGRAVFEGCEIVSRLRPGQAWNGYVAAPDTDVHQPFGLVFRSCRLAKEKGVAPQTVALGRPWRHTRSFADGRYGDPDAVGAAAYLDCWMDDHIAAEGWSAMGYGLKGGGRAMMQPEEARFYEFMSSGPGANASSPRRRQLTADQARAFATANVLNGWTPA